MGACYSVILKVNLTDEQGAIKALNEHILKDTRTSYSIDESTELQTFDGLMNLLLAGFRTNVLTYTKGNFKYYESDFNASYGWESVMMEWFDVMAPFLKDNSTLLIYPDNDYDKLVIKNGKCVQVH